jgi:hypothetical protein
VRHCACQIEGDQWSFAGDDVKGVWMKARVANPNEKRCPACDGTGVLAAIWQATDTKPPTDAACNAQRHRAEYDRSVALGAEPSKSPGKVCLR